MDWHIIQDKVKIAKIFEHLIEKKTAINVQIEEIETQYTSRFIELLPHGTYQGVSGEEGGDPEVVLEKLDPQVGNELIQKFPVVDFEFFIDDYFGRCQSIYNAISSHYPYYGLYMSFPQILELEEKRETERLELEAVYPFSALLRLGRSQEDDQLYELKIINLSQDGLGLLVTERESDLLEKLDTGERIPEILISKDFRKLGGTIRHKTKIEHGKYQGNYILGIASDRIGEADERCNFKELSP